MSWSRYQTEHLGQVSESFELADVGRYGRRLAARFVHQARIADRPEFRRLISDHLGLSAASLPVTEESWPAYEQVNVQGALDAWLAEPGRGAEVIGISGYRHRDSFSMADLLTSDAEDPFGQPRPGSLSSVALPIGPDGATRSCLRAAVVLADDGQARVALLLRGPDPEEGIGDTRVEIVANDPIAGPRLAARLRALTLEHNVYRGQVISFGHDLFGDRDSMMKFHRRQPVPRSSLILPEETFQDVRRQVVGVARNRERLQRAGQHLKRGLLLYGPPGVGKTHTVRHLIGDMTETTVVELSGDALHAIKEACSIARTLQPSMIVVEDVDLIAEQRDHYEGESSLLFTLLNEMDGLAEDADVVFLLTTNRADLLEAALSSRPGRVDQAVHIGLPDADARRRLIELYRGRLTVDTSRLDEVIERTEGVTASFLKELLRRAAVAAAERSPGESTISVSAVDLDGALAELLDTRNRMTRRALGYADSSRDEFLGSSEDDPDDDWDDD